MMTNMKHLTAMNSMMSKSIMVHMMIMVWWVT